MENTMTKATAMTTRSYRLRFLTPAFLGNAEQNAQWRTPPFKALLRQWWRVAYAAQQNFNVDIDQIRHAEGLLFGHAWLENDRDKNNKAVHARKSRIRMRLRATTGEHAWTRGSQVGVQPLSTGQETNYAWFGLINRGRGAADRGAIRPSGSEAERDLVLAFPALHEPEIQQALVLVHAFGQVGSRSRGGWGAIHLDPEPKLNELNLLHFARDLRDCLSTDWAMSLGKDDSGLMLWESRQTWPSWDKAMDALARLRKEVRMELKVDKDLRSALGFASSGRMPSPLRWKPVQTNNNQLSIRAFALPHQIPKAGGKQLSPADLHRAWRIASQALDARFKRIAE